MEADELWLQPTERGQSKRQPAGPAKRSTGWAPLAEGGPVKVG